MKLVCPHCAKVIDVPESSAGQTTSCPLCMGPLTVPYAPSAAAPPGHVPPAGPPAQPSPLPPPPPPPTPPDPLAHTTAWTPTSGYVVPPLPKPSKTSSAAGKGMEMFGRLKQFTLPESFHDWFGVGVLTVVFFLFFFPWLSVSVGDTHLVDQSGLSVGFGYSSATKEGEYLTKELPGAGLIIIAFLAGLVGLILLIVILVERGVESSAVQNMKPTLQRIVALRDPIVLGCLVVITLIFLLYYVLISFPLEHAAWSPKAADTMITGLKLKIEGTIEQAKTTEMVGMQWLKRRGWFSLAVLLSLVATLWLGCRWLTARGLTSRWPRLMLQWPATESPHLSFDATGREQDPTIPRNN